MAAGHISQDLADELAVGALSPEDEEQARRHAAECSACAVLVRDAERVASTLALGLAPARAPAELKRHVMGAAQKSAPRGHRFLRFGRAAAGVAALIVAAGAFAGMLSIRSQIDSLRNSNSELKSQVAEALSTKVEIAALTRRLSDEERNSVEQSAQARSDRELLLAMLSPKSDIAEVYSTDAAATSIGRLIWNDEQKRVWFVADDLPPRPSGETYQLWVSSGGIYLSLGIFQPDSTGFARYVANVPQGMTGYDTAVVTIEKAGGSTERSGPSIFAADLSKFRH